MGVDIKLLEELCAKTLDHTEFTGQGDRHVGKVRDSYVKGDERNIVVTNTPGVLTEAAADFGFTMIQTAGRRIAESDRFV